MPLLTDRGGWTTITYSTAEVEAQLAPEARWTPWEQTQTVVVATGGLLLVVWVVCRWRWYARLMVRRWRELGR